jgi:hypothetical protein
MLLLAQVVVQVDILVFGYLHLLVLIIIKLVLAVLVVQKLVLAVILVVLVWQPYLGTMLLQLIVMPMEEAAAPKAIIKMPHFSPLAVQVARQLVTQLD